MPLYMTQQTTIPITAKTTQIAAGAAGPTVIKASAGTFFGILTQTSAAGTPAVFDNASTNAGTIVAQVIASSIGLQDTISDGVQMVNGITVSGGATAPAMTIYWL